ncbi:formate dehydrogenase subunit alpha [Candidatus Methylomirabilis lanthanidiphila]|uniref:Formate dehydrogenase subunit alpha n=1 Tax=Candidatus Methylomirabilis lanthanidiphila TaxID=2211376 RepID=A0A564ZNH3_9BACT|nr:formate dehydrogenase subunit alpha [Candidatus Methylomirabilis lanthanidiphila]
MPGRCGMLVKTLEGRAVKVEGNPDHPVNRGRLCARGQASLQGLYNPDRIRQPLLKDTSGRFKPLSWDEAEGWLATRLQELHERRQGIVWLTPHMTGALDHLIDRWLQAFGSQRRLRYEPFAYDAIRVANKRMFGLDTIPTYDLQSSQRIVSFGSDFLETWISPVMYAREFAAMRAYKHGRMGRFIFIGPRRSLTAANADRWVAVPPGTEGMMALGMIRVIIAEGLWRGAPKGEIEQIKGLVDRYTPRLVSQAAEVTPEDLEALARLFAQADPGLALAGGIAGDGQQATATVVAVNLLNYVTGNIGRTVRFGPLSSLGRLSSHREMVDLIQAMNDGKISALFFSEVNPIFSLPGSAGFEQALGQVPLVVSCSSFMDETTAKAALVLPTHTPLESWGDDEPWEGLHGLMQPAMEPVFQTKSLGDLLLSLAKRHGGAQAEAFAEGSFYELLRNRWREIHRRIRPETEFETFWSEALQRGGVFQEVHPRSVSLNLGALPDTLHGLQVLDQPDGLILVSYPSINHFDGRGANRPWLQELPDPLTQLTWDGWLDIHPEDAQRLTISEGDLLNVKSAHGEIELPAHLSTGVRRGTVTAPIGQGHTAYGRYADPQDPNATGFSEKRRSGNPFALLAAQPESDSGGLLLSITVTLTNTGLKYPLASVSGSTRQHDRGIAQAVPLETIARGLEGNGHGSQETRVVRQMYPPHEHPHHRWGMAVDLNACIGCSACVVACYAENNIPVVGKEQLVRGREMSWIRIERFEEGPADRPAIRFIPMLCQHCDNAPCEPVCPVYATVHNAEGLNIQVYNRCVGTRYCSNNCPYKVRRFNWFTYPWPEPLHLQLNPDVTVRESGVMEKCTFCIQRITAGKAKAKDEGRPVRDGEIVPACAQTCPTRAIVFGDLKDPASEVSRLSQGPRRYRVLEHLNTQPAITYLKKINP